MQKWWKEGGRHLQILCKLPVVLLPVGGLGLLVAVAALNPPVDDHDGGPKAGLQLVGLVLLIWLEEGVVIEDMYMNLNMDMNMGIDLNVLGHCAWLTCQVPSMT